MYDFICIDFETANNNMNSACSLGLVAVKDKKIVDSKYFLIRPPTLEFDNTNIRIHGIRPDDVKDAPEFPEVWDEIKAYFKDNYIIAHNAVFDMSVLKSCLLTYDLEIPDFYYICSIPISTRACSGEDVGRSLEDRTLYFNIELEEHHNALSDAIACAKLVIECMNRKKRRSLESYLNTYTSIPIKRFSELNPQKRFRNKGFPKNVAISEIVATVEDFDQSHVLYGKNIVFTGELKEMSRREAMQAVVNVGGILKSSVSSKTDYVVVGIQDKSIVGKDGMNTKERKAYELLEKGYDIKIINEEEFLKYIGV
ncbi:MAG: exonuclease domain-containing protein [Caldicoprobacterales bacterium]